MTDATPARWQPLLGGVLMNLALGVIYAWSVFVAPFGEDFGWNRTQVSVVFTIAILSVGSWFVVAGFLQDRFGPQKVAAFGGILYALGFYLASQTESLIWLYITFGAIAGAGNGFGYAIPIPVCSKWFPDRRGLAVGLVVGGYGAGSGIYGPLAREVLIPAYGWQGTMQISAAVFLVMTLAGAWLLRNPPPGYKPPTAAPAPAASAAPRTAAAPVGRDFATGEMIRTPTFYLLWIAYCLGAASGLMVISQLVPVGEAAGLGAAAGLGLTIGAFGNTGGRVLSGWMSDTFGRLNTLRLMVLLSAVALPLFYLFAGQAVLYYLLLVVIYYCYGTLLSVFASTCADFYGTRNMGVNYGLLFSAWGIAGIVGPVIAGRVFDATQSYEIAFYLAAGLSVVALAALMLAKPPQAPSAAS
ncbi:MAG: OFA family MFS transporter [Acidobacteria bacterium]|nr:OFA family MFS transporter [Acidobacteriota bacterium]